MDESTNDVIIQVELDRDLLNRDLANLRQDLEKINDIKVTADVKQVTTKINEIKKSLQDTAIPLNLQPNIIGFLAAINQIPPQSIGVNLKLNQDSFVADALQLQQKRLEFGVAIKEKEGETFSALVTQIRSRILGAANQFNTAKIPIAIAESATENLTALKASIDKRLASLKSALEITLDLKPGELKRIQSLVKSAIVPPAESKRKPKQSGAITSQTNLPDVQASLDFDTAEDDVRNIRQQVENLKTLINTPAGNDFVGSLFDNQTLGQLKEFGKLLRDEFNIENIKLNAKEPLRQAILDAIPEVERQLNEVESRFNQTIADINSDPSNQIKLELDDTQARIDLNAFLERIPESQTIKILLNLTGIESDISQLKTLIPEQESIKISGTISPETEESVDKLLSKLNETQNLLVNLVADKAKQELNELSLEKTAPLKISISNKDELNSLLDIGIKEVSNESILAEKEKAQNYINSLDSLFLKTDLYFVRNEEVLGVAKNAQEKINEVKELLYKTSIKEVTKTVVEAERARIQQVINDIKQVLFKTALKEVTKTDIQAERSRIQETANELDSLDFSFSISSASNENVNAEKNKVESYIKSLDPILFETSVNSISIEALTKEINASQQIVDNLEKILFATSLKEVDSASITNEKNKIQNIINEAKELLYKTSLKEVTKTAIDVERSRIQQVLNETKQVVFKTSLKEIAKTDIDAEISKVQNAVTSANSSNFNSGISSISNESIDAEKNRIQTRLNSIGEVTFNTDLAKIKEDSVATILTDIQNAVNNAKKVLFKTDLYFVREEDIINVSNNLQEKINSVKEVLFKTSLKEVTKTAIQAERNRIQKIAKEIDSLDFSSSISSASNETVNQEKSKIQSYIDSIDSISFKSTIAEIPKETLLAELNRIQLVVNELEKILFKTSLNSIEKIELEAERNNAQQLNKEISSISFDTSLKEITQKAIDDERKRIQTVINDSITKLKFLTTLQDITVDSVNESIISTQTKADSASTINFKSSINALTKQQVNEVATNAQSISNKTEAVIFAADLKSVTEETITAEHKKIQTILNELKGVLFKTDLYFVRNEEVLGVAKNAQEKINEVKELLYKTSIKEVLINSIESEKNRIQQILTNEIEPVKFKTDIKAITKGSLETEQSRIQSVVNTITPIKFQASAEISQSSVTESVKLLNSINDNANSVRSFIAQNPIDISLNLIDIADKNIAKYISKLQVRVSEKEVFIRPTISTTDGAVTGFVTRVERQIFAAKPVAILGVEPSSASLKEAITDLRRQAAKADVKVTLDLDDSNITKSFDKLSAFTSSLAKTTKFIETGGFDVLMSKFDVITSRYVDLATLMANVVLSPSTDITELVKLLTVLDSIKAQVTSLDKTSITIAPGKLATSPQPSQQSSIDSGFSLKDLNEQSNDRLATIRRAYTYEIEEVERLRKAQQISQSQADERVRESGIRFNQSLKSVYEDRTAIISDALSNNQIDSGVAAQQLAKSEAAIKSATENQTKLEKGETDEQIAKRIANQEKAELEAINRITKSQLQALTDRINNEKEILNKQLKDESISQEDAKQFKKQLELDLNQDLARIYNDRTAALQDSISRGLLSEKAASQAMLESRKQVAAANEKIAKQQISEIKPATAVSESLVSSRNDFNRTIDNEKQQVIRNIAELDITDYKTGVATVERLEASLNQKIDALYRERLDKLRKFSTDRVSDQQYVAKEVIDLENKIADNTSRNLRKLETDAKSVRGVINFSRITDELKEAALQVAVYGTLFAAGGLPFQIAKTAIELEKYSRLIKSVSKDNADASKSFALVRSTVQDYGLQLEPLIAGYGKLRAAAKDTGLSVQETNKLFRGIALASGGLQLSADETTGTIKAFTDALSKGTFQSEELKGQLGDRLVGAFNLVAKSLGKTTAQLTDELKNGQVKSVEVARALSVTLEQEYGGAAAAAAKTTAGLLNSLSSQFATFSEKAGKDLLPIVNETLGTLNGLLEGVTENSSLIIPVLTGVAAALAVVAGKKLLLDLLPITFNALVSGAANFATAVNNASGSNDAFTAKTINLTESQKSLASSLKANFAAIAANAGIFAVITLGVSAATLAYSNATARAKDYEDALKSILELEERIAARKASKPTDGSAFGAEKALAERRRLQQEGGASFFFDPRNDRITDEQYESFNKAIRENRKVDTTGVLPLSEDFKILNKYNASLEDSNRVFTETSKVIQENKKALDELRSSRTAYNNLKSKENAGQVVTADEAKFLREYEEKLNTTTERIGTYSGRLKDIAPQNQIQANSVKNFTSELNLQSEQLRNTTLAVKQYVSATSEIEKVTGLLQRRLDLGQQFSRDPVRNKDNKAARENLDDEIELAKIAKQIKDKENALAAEADLDKRRSIEQEILELKIKNVDKLDSISERSFNREKDKREEAEKAKKKAAEDKLKAEKDAIDKRLDKELAAIDKVYRADIKLINERSKAYDKVKADLDIIGKNLDRQNTLLTSQKDLAKSISDLRAARAEQALNLTNETNDIGKQLKESNSKIQDLQSKIQKAYFTPDVAPNFEEALKLEQELSAEVKRRNELQRQSKDLRSQTGRPDRPAPGITDEQDSIIRRQKEETNLASLKFQSLREQLNFEKQLLNLDFKKQENALKLLQIEQEIAKTKLRGEQRTARRDLENAQSELKNIKPDATLKEQREARNKVEDALGKLEDINAQIGLTDKTSTLIREQFGDLDQNKNLREQSLTNRGTLESEQFRAERQAADRKNRNELAGAGIDPKLAPQQPIIQPLTAQEFATQMTPIASQQTTQIINTINAAATLIESAVRSSVPVINVQGAQQTPALNLGAAAGRNL